MKNTLKYSVSAVSYAFLALTLGGSFLQIYLIEQGFSEEQTANLFSAMRAIQTLAILLTMHLATRTRRASPGCAAVFPASLPFCLLLLFMPTETNAQLPLYLLGALFYVAIGAYCIFSYRLPYTALRIESYGRISGVTGAISAALGLGASISVSLLQERLAYRTIMHGVLILSAGVAVAGFLATITLRERIADAPPAKEPRDRLFTYRHFTMLIVPNLLRGLTTGVMGIAVTLGYTRGILDSRSAAAAVIITGCATLLGSTIYSMLPRTSSPTRLLLGATAVAAVAMPLLLLGGTVLFFLMLGLITLFTAIEDIAVPVAVVKIVDADMIARYTGGRMLLHTLGTAIGGFIAVPLFHWLSPLGIMLLTALAHLAFGLTYYLYFSKIPKNI